jgi:uncharacterized membrane protein YbhN (UPF0104 family)
MFAAAIFVLYNELEDIRLAEIVDGVKALRGTQLAAAFAITILSYLLLTGYDFLALRYVRCTLRLRRVLFASLVAFAFTNSLGFALISGGSTRYRIYSGFGLGPVTIGEIVAFCTITYALGVTTAAGLLFLTNSAEIASLVGLPPRLVLTGGALLLLVDIAYFVLLALRQAPISIGSYRLRPPTIAQGVTQIVLASVDQAVAAAVLYVLLPADLTIDFWTFLGVYLIAAPLAVLSLVPGGLGVLESVFLVMLAHTPKATAFGSLLVYRCIYFLLPFVVAIVGDAIYEVRRAAREFAGL